VTLPVARGAGPGRCCLAFALVVFGAPCVAAAPVDAGALEPVASPVCSDYANPVCAGVERDGGVVSLTFRNECIARECAGAREVRPGRCADGSDEEAPTCPLVEESSSCRGEPGGGPAGAVPVALVTLLAGAVRAWRRRRCR
jgi:hypothetical protein